MKIDVFVAGTRKAISFVAIGSGLAVLAGTSYAQTIEQIDLTSAIA